MASVRLSPGRTPAHAAAGAGELDVLRKLVDRAADLVARDPDFDATPLTWARFIDRPDVCDALPMGELFAELAAVQAVMDATEVAWSFAGGWALDLHLGRVTRAHDDVDVLVWDRDIRRFAAAVPSALAERPETGELVEWDRRRSLVPGAEALRFDVNGVRVQVLVALTNGSDWVFHRGRRTTRLPLAQLERRNDGIPYVDPRVVLLFKSRQMRAKDNEDFNVVASSLAPDEKTWLRDRVARWDPDHAWLERLN